ncbi:piwi-like protein 1 [Dunckerocampus dactyliophorus]|uniref:piwi-like protein 1 n=1 Tax=Dunckerocampus dactyliophorus TaxID=161453 RepID=UPI002405B58E|nr:piwi-like protein 1 [Dunckerocampus dactyliophorus]
MDELKMAFVGALEHYRTSNKFLPSHIIVYRDGVEDGQLHSVVNYEVNKITDSFNSMGQGYMPNLSVVVVNKRISCRFFKRTKKSKKRINPPIGTVVDSRVTRPEWNNFYLVSQAADIGSVSSTHYNVVYDQSGLEPDDFQLLTFRLCQYAHKLAFLVGQSIHREPNIKLDKLFYL